MATRFGTSKKTKHVQLRFLFIQELVASGVVSFKKVAGTSNPSDVMTKYITISGKKRGPDEGGQMWPVGGFELIIR